ncbi:MAG: hypothetical protein LBB28_03415 [Synergistaceae bacterium]|nr:hypothetical protein [Synergistaceae bacterium]
MKKAFKFMAVVTMISAALFSCQLSAMAAFAPANPGPTVPLQTAPQPNPPQAAPQGQVSSIDGIWQAVGTSQPVMAGLMGGQYQVMMNGQATEMGTFTITGNQINWTPSGGQTYSNYYQLTPDGMSMTLTGNDGAITWRKTQQTQQTYPPQPPYSYPETPPIPQPPVPQPPVQTPPVPQPPVQAPPVIQQPGGAPLSPQALAGTWQAFQGNVSATVIFNGNQYAFSINNQMADYGTFTLQGNVIYYHSATGSTQFGAPVQLQLSSDGRSLLASDVGGANGLMWMKSQ